LEPRLLSADRLLRRDGDALAALLRDENVALAQQTVTSIPRLGQAAHTALAPEAQVRLDAGFTNGSTRAMAGLDWGLPAARLRQRLQACTGG